MPRKKIEIDIDYVRQLRERGLSLEDVAERLGVSRNIVVKRCMENGVVYGKGHSPSNKKRNAIREKKPVYVAPIKEREARFFEKFANDRNLTQFEYVGGYQGEHKKVIIRCKTCGEQILRTPHCLFDSRFSTKCPKCEAVMREQKKAERKEKRKEKRKAEIAKREEEELAKDKICRQCGNVFHSKYADAAYCSSSCKGKFKRRNKDTGHRGRAKRYGVEYDSSITWQSLSKELGHCNCQICGKPCDPNDTSWNGVFGPLYPTVDCIVAMKNGGGYVHGNVQLAHAICNSVKRDLDDYDDIAEAVSQHAPNGGRNPEWKQARTAQNIGSGNRRVNRRRRRVSQHGAACTTIPRNDTRNCRARSGVG